jgi:hypothetical protein
VESEEEVVDDAYPECRGRAAGPVSGRRRCLSAAAACLGLPAHQNCAGAGASAFSSERRMVVVSASLCSSREW